MMLGLPDGVGTLFSRRTKGKLALALLGSVIQAALELVAVASVVPLMQTLTGATPSFGPLGTAQDVFGTSDRNSTAIWLSVVIFGCFIIKGIFTIAYRWWVLGMVADQQVETSEKLFRYFLRSPYQLHLRRTTAEFLRIGMESVEVVFNGAVIGFIGAVTAGATMIAIVGSILVIKPLPSFLMLIYFGGVGLALYLFSRRRSSEAGAVALMSAQDTFKAAIEPFGVIKDIIIDDNAEYFISTYSAARRRRVQAIRLASYLSELPKYILELVFIIGISGMTIVIFSTSGSSNALATLALFAVAGFRVLPNMTALLSGLTAVRTGGHGVHTLVDEMREADSVDLSNRPAAEAMAFSHSLDLRDLTFAYSPDSGDVLQGISLHVPAGESIAIVGGSGAGKSTLIDLILGLHTPTSGKICADGQDIAANIRGWQRNLAMVPQTVMALDDTFEANILFGDNATPENLLKVHRAIEQSQLRDLIEALPAGLQSQVGESGNKLSGGQRQRLGIARALYRSPKLLVLDEATSALDNFTERKITDVIDTLRGQITVLVVAHRLSTVRNCDSVAYLADGQLRAHGTFDEVRRDNADFARLADLSDLGAPPSRSSRSAH